QKLMEKKARIQKEKTRLEKTMAGANAAVQQFLEKHGSMSLKTAASLAEILRRPEIRYEYLAEIDPDRPDLPLEVTEQVEIAIKYDGYIRRQLKQVEQFQKLEQKRIPEDLNYEEIGSLRLEAVQKLKLCKPVSIGQASRISGVSPADIAVLLVYLEQKRGQEHGV
ncbi:MAG: tRNA uridine-5-carboxymethylaminomethyl(34) synthesis enzyme MnmG, partial [Lachnospiraceae bacterium]|nr:tRNA uridine-5-carboxymethylaminomethyl(34) synthesis enzyme MnmG [Lachnospiraceae bacterium]